MKCCINPQCPKPHNPDDVVYCQACGVKIPDLLRGRFRIIRLLGQGGFGRTYLAEDYDKLNEYCVVKQFVPSVQGTAALQKAIQLFEREARQLQQLGKHDQIPILSAYFEDTNQLYLAQEYIEGENLSELLEQQGVWKEPQVKNLLFSLLPLLNFIHEKNVIHRDIKPENIIRRRNGKCVLIDFGVAKDLSATVVYTQVATRVGSHGYVAREQMRGGEAYPASDLYSLGVTCFYLLTQHPPLELWSDYGYSWTENWQRYLNQNISPEFKKILDKLLQKQMKDRYSSAGEVLWDLQRSPRRSTSLPKTVLSVPSQPPQPVPSQPPQPVPSQPKPVKTSPISWQNLTLITTLTGHSNTVRSVAFSPDGRTLASGSDDKTIK